MFPFIIDLHCDLLSYLQEVPDVDPRKKGGIGCSFPALIEGNVKMQIMAIYTSTQKDSSELGLRQSLIFKEILTKYNDLLYFICDSETLNTVSESKTIGAIAAIENASGFCEENDSLKDGFRKLEKIISNTGGILYIGLTHHTENRFGGGNTSKAGLKEDGKALLEYVNGKKIAIDFSHTSDALAFEMMNYISKYNLDLPVIASHSNFRSVFNHPRNLPDDIAKEIIKRNGVIGINFVRAFVNNENPNAIYDHIDYGITLGGADALCFGADFFYTDSHPDQSRRPFFHKEHENAGCYPSIQKNLSERISPELIEKISNLNVIKFIKRIWK